LVADGDRPEQTTSDGTTEVEWQFDALDLRPVERWLAGLPVGQLAAVARGGPALTALAAPTRRLVDRYLDTDDWRIHRAGFVLRVRRRGRHDEVTLKDTRPADPDGLRRRLEVTEPLPPGGLAELGDEGPVGWRVAAVAGNRPLGTVLEVRTRRRPFTLRAGDDEVAELALDETVLAAGPGERPAQLRRVEVEVDPAWAERLAPVVEELRAACGLRPAALSKFEAGLLALGLDVPGLPELGPTAVTEDATLGDLAYAVVRRHLRVMLAHEPGTRLGEDPEDLHDMRVATRRLRAAIDMFADVLPARAEHFRAELRWLAAVLGAVRDLDVQLGRLDELESWTATWGGDGDAGASPLEELRSLLVDERTAARRDLLVALDEPRYARLVTGLVTMVRPGAARRVPLARSPAVLTVPDSVLARHKGAVKAARRAKRTGQPADYHRLRIRCKRLRYALEFTSDLYGNRAERFVRRLTRLQDGLGLMQDAEVAMGRLFELATRDGSGLGPAAVFAMGGVAERYRNEAHELLDGMPRRLAALRAEEWHDLARVMEQRRVHAAAGLPPPRPLRPTAVTPAAPAAAGTESTDAPAAQEPPTEPTTVPGPPTVPPALTPPVPFPRPEAAGPPERPHDDVDHAGRDGHPSGDARPG